jgi:hypothetical protein
VDVVIHSYRHRLGLVDGYPAYVEVERRLAELPVITVPTITLDGGATAWCRPPTGERPRLSSTAVERTA